MHKLLILSKDYSAYENLITQAGLQGLSIQANGDPEEALPSGADCDLVMGEPSLIRQVINHLPKARWVQSTWAGVEPLLGEGMRQGYQLTNARNVYGEMMSEYVFSYLLMIERRILQRWMAQNERKWDDTLSGNLKGKRIGIMGVGSIGACLAETAHHFGMKVNGYTMHSESCGAVEHYFHGGELKEFAKELDYLVCTLPGTPATRGIISRELLTTLPKHAWLINVGRGSSVDEAALVEALNNHTIGGAVLDVFIEEPLPVDHPLWQTPNTFITFHTAAKNYLPDIADIFIENYRRFIQGERLQNLVDFERKY